MTRRRQASPTTDLGGTTYPASGADVQTRSRGTRTTRNGAVGVEHGGVGSCQQDNGVVMRAQQAGGQDWLHGAGGVRDVTADGSGFTEGQATVSHECAIFAVRGDRSNTLLLRAPAAFPPSRGSSASGCPQKSAILAASAGRTASLSGSAAAQLEGQAQGGQLAVCAAVCIQDVQQHGLLRVWQPGSQPAAPPLQVARDPSVKTT